MKKVLFLLFAVAVSAGVALAADSSTAKQITAQALNQRPAQYIGQQVMLTGVIDRKLGDGSYIISDSSDVNSSDESHRILVMTPSAPTTTVDTSKQRAGTIPSSFKQGDSVQLTGKVEQFSTSDQLDTISPVSDREIIRTESVNLPVIVTRSGDLKLKE